MSNVAKRPAVDDGRAAGHILDEIGVYRLAQQDRHGGVGVQVGGRDRRALEGLADDDAAQPCLEIGEVAGEAKNRHDLGRGGNIEAALTWHTLRSAAETEDDIAQGAVVHVDGPPPGHAAGIDAKRIALMEVVVEHRGEEIVRGGDGVKVAGEVKIDLQRRLQRRFAAAGRAAFDAKNRAQ